MNSFNHYAYGAIGDWMYRVMTGIDTYEDGVGYKHSKIKPFIGEGFSGATASLETYYGMLSSSWKAEGASLSLEVEIPANTTATIYFPANDAAVIFEGGKPISSTTEIQVAGKEEGYVLLKMGSGKYNFTR